MGSVRWRRICKGRSWQLKYLFLYLWKLRATDCYFNHCTHHCSPDTKTECCHTPDWKADMRGSSKIETSGLVKTFSVGGWAESSGSNTEKAVKEAADYENSMALFCGSKTKVIFLQLKEILEMFWSLTTKWKSVLIWLNLMSLKASFFTGLSYFPPSSHFPKQNIEWARKKEETKATRFCFE